MLIADDSRTARTHLRAILEADPAISVVGEARDGVDAVRLTKELRPGLVVMDIEMPVLGGIEATKQIMVEVPTPIIVVSARHDVREVQVGLRAVRAGALTVMAKPGGPSIDDPESRRLVMLVKALAEVHVVRHHARHGKVDDAHHRVLTPVRGRPAIEAVAVAASTGGPAAVFRFLEALPGDLRVPVLLVQHIAEGFDAGLAAWLRSATTLPLALASDRAPALGGRVYVAPHDRHLEVADTTIRLTDGAPVGGFRPSADVLFRSMAARFGAGAAAVVLTGMGDDGLAGADAVRRAGGLVLAQDEDTSAVFGMPKVVAAAGLAHEVGPVELLARRVALSAPRGEGDHSGRPSAPRSPTDG